MEERREAERGGARRLEAGLECEGGAGVREICGRGAGKVWRSWSATKKGYDIGGAGMSGSWRCGSWRCGSWRYGSWKCGGRTETYSSSEPICVGLWLCCYRKKECPPTCCQPSPNRTS